MALLPQPWPLHDVDDVEALLARAVSRSSFVGDLLPDERDDLLASLFAVAWQLADNFDPARGRFSTVLYVASQRRAVDWLRATRGRTRWVFGDGSVHERERPVVVSLDERRERGLDDADAGVVLDDAGDRVADLLGVLRARARPPAGYPGRVGSGATRRAR